jgi:hypothetical protein
MNASIGFAEHGGAAGRAGDMDRTVLVPAIVSTAMLVHNTVALPIRKEQIFLDRSTISAGTKRLTNLVFHHLLPGSVP